MSARSGLRDEEGIVLLLVLVLVVVAISTAYALSKTSFLEVMSSRQRAQHARADVLARSGVVVGQRTLQDDLIEGDELTRSVESDLDAWAVLSSEELVLPGDAHLHVAISDAGGKINLNSLVDAEGKRVGETSKAFLKESLARIRDTTPELKQRRGLGDEDIDDLADAILDWLDRDEETRLGTPEQEFYVDMRKASSAPVNRPVFSLDELAAVPGMDALLLRALAAYFTTQPMFPPADGGGVNLNTAPPHVLGLIYHGVGDELELLDPRDVFTLQKAREEGRVFCPTPGAPPCTDFFSELGIAPGEQIFPPLSYKSRVFRIESDARVGEAHACVKTVVDRGDGGDLKTLYYELGC